MKNFFILYLITVAFSINSFSCGNNKGNNRHNPGDSTLPEETKKANTNYKPSFNGQTRTPSISTRSPYQVEKIADDLSKPWAIVPIPDGRFLVTEKTGYILIMDANGKQIKKIVGFPEVDDSGQGGLLDVAPDPDFTTNKIIYWSFSEKNGDKNLMAVAKGILNEGAGKIEAPRVIFRATPAMESKLHFGSRLIFDKSGYLFVSTGERSILDGRKQAQLLSSGLGKIFRITKEGQPAPGNPFINTENAMPEIYAYGIRNAQSLDINPTTGELWEAEFGPRGGDELNIIHAGKDYGWPTITYGIEYSGEKVGDGIQKKNGMEQPIYYWDPVISPSGMVFYKGNDIPEWENNLFIGGLNSSHIARLIIKNNKVVAEEWLLKDLKQRFRDVAYYNGMLFTVTDEGNLYRIKKK